MYPWRGFAPVERRITARVRGPVSGIRVVSVSGQRWRRARSIRWCTGVIVVCRTTHRRRRADTRRIVGWGASTRRGIGSRGRVVASAVRVVSRPLDRRAKVIYSTWPPQRAWAARSHTGERWIWFIRRIPRAVDFPGVAAVFWRVAIRQA